MLRIKISCSFVSNLSINISKMSDNNSEKLKKDEYYARGEDSDFIEEEKEAIAIQNKRLQRMIDLNLVENNNKLENSDDENKSDSSISYNKFNRCFFCNAIHGYRMYEALPLICCFRTEFIYW